jgi:hypothetical protein
MKMSVNLNVVIAGVAKTVAAKPYAFPKKGNLPAEYALTLNGVAAKLARTGGGTYPTYIYVMVGEQPYYLPKNVTPDAGSDMTVAPVGATLKEELAAAGVTVEKALEAAKVLEAAPALDTTNEVLMHIAKAIEAPKKPARRKAAK